MRIPFASSLKSRDGTLDQDAKVANGIVEPDGDAAPTVRRRPGLTDLGLVRAGAAQMLYYWFGKVRTVIGDYLDGATGVGQITNTTWNPDDKDPDVTLSNGNLTLSSTGGFGRSADSVASGEWAFQVTVVTGQARTCVGLAASTAAFTQLGSGNDSIAYDNYVGGGAIIKGGTALTEAVDGFTTADVIRVVYDADTPSVKFYKNGVLQYTATGPNVPTGPLFAAAGNNTGGSASVVTASFGVSASGASLSPTSAGEQFSAQDNGANSPESLLMIKNFTQAWVVDTSDVVTQITDVDYPGKYTVTLASLTRSGTVATATTAIPTNFQVGANVTIAGVNEAGWNGTYAITGVTPVSVETVSGDAFGVTITRSGSTATATCVSAPHGLTSGDSVRIAGADQSEYNGTFTATVTLPTVFTFPITLVAQDPTSPATGTITAATRESSAIIAGSASSANVAYSADVLGTVDVGDSLVISNASSGVVPDGTYTVTAKPAASTATISVSSPYSIYVNASATVSRALPSVTSVTYDGGAAMLGRVTFGAAHRLTTGAGIVISGATETLYNGKKLNCTAVSATVLEFEIAGATAAGPYTPATGVIEGKKVVGSTTGTFTFTVDGTETTPATGTITAFSGRSTVPGIAYLNGYFVVMDEQGVIYNSASDDPETWNALEYTSALNEPGAGKAIAKSGNYIAAFKEWSTEFFYDAQNPTESPLSPVDNGFTLVGCANGWSVANVDGSLMWIAQSKKHKGRQVYRMAGTEQEKVSTPDVERILNADTLATVYAWGARIDGHPCYVLSLVGSDVTIVYDIVSGAWYQWTSLTIGSGKSISSITLDGTTATVTFGAAHGMSDGDPLTISGATQSGYNGLHQVRYVSPTVVTVEVAAGTVTPATGTILGYAYTESYLKWSHYAAANGVDVVLHVSDGHLYEIDPAEGLDDGVPVNYFIRTARLDGGATTLKKFGVVRVLGEKVSDSAMLRWSDDDCSTFTKYREVDLSAKQPELRRCGSFRRRNFEFRHVGDSLPRVAEIEA